MPESHAHTAAAANKQIDFVRASTPGALMAPMPLIHVLTNPPQHAGRVCDAKITHTPRLQRNRPNFQVVAPNHTTLLHLVPPGIHILHQQMHHKILCQVIGTKILQQKTHMLKMEISHAAAFRGHGKAHVFIKLFGKREIFRWHKSFDFSDL